MRPPSKLKKIIACCILACSPQAILAQSPAKKTDNKDAKRWVKSRVWANGLNLKVSKAVNANEFERQYMAETLYWDKAFKFLSDANIKNIAPGKYTIDGDNVYAIITNGPNKQFANTKWESHRNYIDLQYIIEGKEKMGVAPLESAIVTKPYDQAKDAAHYTAEGNYFIATPKEFFLFFPSDAHRPNILVAGYDTLRKVVIKIRYKN
jgi:biofilm protein TabA